MKSRVQRGRRRLAELLGQCCTLTLDARGVPMDYDARPGCAAAAAAAEPSAAVTGRRAAGRPRRWVSVRRSR